jgi:hypothetical protein
MLRGHLQFTIGESWWTAHPWIAVVDQCRGNLGAMTRTILIGTHRQAF